MKSRTPDTNSPTWEKDLIRNLASSALREQRVARRWSIFFRFLFFGYLFLLLVMYLPRDTLLESAGKPHTALVNVDGLIVDGSEASADRIIKSLEAAFEDSDTQGVILQINSPGGSPVQAGRINDEITRLRRKHPEIPLHAVITDIGASGGYYVAVAADRIYVDKSSIVGSIGVLMNGFGFVDAMEKLGIDRRLKTAGEHKGFLDPFSPENPTEIAHLQTVLDEVHRQFVDAVKKGRGKRLQADRAELFSGLVWTGSQAISLGLADELGNSESVAREVIGTETIVDFTWERDYLERFADRFGAAAGEAISMRLGLGTASFQ